MDPALKNRLVGAAVLLLLAVVFLPMLFDGANQQALLSDTRMPPPPDVPAAGELLAEPAPRLEAGAQAIEALHTQAAPEGEVVPPVAAAPAADPAAVPAPPAPAAAPEPAAQGPAAPAEQARLAAITEGWDVQVAAVAAPEGAGKLCTRLQGAGYKCRVKAVQAGGRTLYRVLAGPEIRREDALALRDRLAKDAAVGKPAGMLVRYVP